MALIVQKFGGTSVANISLMKKIASKIANTYERGNSVVVVLSAMAGTTDRLICLANEVCDFPNKKELDVLLATGEQVTVGIMAMILKEMGYRARSLLAHQIKIFTDSDWGTARILRIETSLIEKLLRNGIIAIIAGFQGCDNYGNITTLGRGGSDISAVAIASALKADLCEIYTDVDGVYTADPNICARAKKLSGILYDEMINMSDLGAKVLHSKSVEFAKKHKIPIHVRSSISNSNGTMVVGKNYKECLDFVFGITYDLNYAMIILENVPDKLSIINDILSPIIKENVFIDMVVQNPSIKGFRNLNFTVLKSEFIKVMAIEKLFAAKTKEINIIGYMNIAKISVVGANIKKHSDIISLIFKTLKKKDINIIMFNVSKMRISCVIDQKHLKFVVKVFHTIFNLDEK